MKSVTKFRDAESNFIKHRIHVYSRRLIDFCVKHQAGTLILLNQEQTIELAKEDPFLLRNWSYYDLISKIKYKARKAGIELIVD